MIVGAISSYRDPLLASAYRSLLPACDAIVIAEGPSGPVDVEPPAIDTRWYTGATRLVEGTWEDEAAKKNELVEQARELDADWLVWVDSDEVLLWPELLPDYFDHFAGQTSIGGFGLRIVEPDGSVYRNNGRVARLELVGRYLMDWTQLELTSGMVVAFTHDLLCTAGGIPHLDMGEWQTLDDQTKLERMGELRPPLAGEPHILHRWHLRPPERQAKNLRASNRDERTFWDEHLPG